MKAEEEKERGEEGGGGRRRVVKRKSLLEVGLELGDPAFICYKKTQVITKAKFKLLIMVTQSYAMI